jgi:hypothetical protein
MDTNKYREFGAVLFALRGVVTALAPQLSVKTTRRLVGTNFENADQLEAKPAYLRQLRAIGVGMAAAGVVNFALQRAHRDTDGSDADIDETDNGSDAGLNETSDGTDTADETDDGSDAGLDETGDETDTADETDDESND